MGWWDSEEEEGREQLQPSLHIQKQSPNTPKHVSLDFRHSKCSSHLMDSTEVCIEVLNQGVWAVWMMESGAHFSPSGTAIGGSEKSQQRTKPLLFLWCCFHNNQVLQVPCCVFKCISLVWDIRERGTFFLSIWFITKIKEMRWVLTQW